MQHRFISGEDNVAVPEAAYHELSYLRRLFPTTLPDPLHPLYRHQTLPGPFWSSSRTTLHGGQDGRGRDFRLPVAQPHRPERPIADELDGRVISRLIFG